MAIDSISGAASVIAPSSLSRLSPPPETRADAQGVASRVSEPRQSTESVRGASPSTRLAGPSEMNNTVGTSQTVVPTSGDNVSVLQIAQSQVSRAYQNGAPSASQLRSASEAYRAEASARDQMAQQQQRAGGLRSTDILA